MKKMLKGIIFGLSNVIPGVCSATVALILGIYEDILNAISKIFTMKVWKKMD